MDRRTFLRNTSIAGISLAAWSCVPSGSRAPQGAGEQVAPGTFELNEATIADLREWMESGRYTSRKITQLYLDRISAIDKGGPGLNAVIELNPEALSIAESLDEERKNGKVRGPLHGIPVLIKDNIDTSDKMQTTAGSLAMEGHRAGKDSAVAKRLRDAGAVLLGKTNLSEWANFRSEKSTSGWSSRGGLTKNPYVLDRNPLGSSSGSGVAVSANLCAVAVGTETDGSVVCPASVNGIVGIKPTVGSVSRTGIIPISATQDTAGPMARTVRDAAILLGVMAGADPDDPVTLEGAAKTYTDYTRFLDAEGLRGKRVGIDKKWKSSLVPVNALFENALSLMRSKGATIVEVDYSEAINDLAKDEMTVLQYEFKAGLDRYLSRSISAMTSLQDIIRFNDAHADRVMPWFGQELLIASQARGPLTDRKYRAAQERTWAGSRRLLRNILEEKRLDTFSGLTISPAACTDLIYGDRFGDIYSGMAPAIAGYPHITVPCGEVFGLPVGLSFFSTAFREPELLAMAFAYEQSSKKRTPPQFIRALE